MRHFRSPFCGRSSTRAADLARKSGRLRGFLKFAPPRRSRCAATTLLEQASRRRKRPYAGLMKTLAAPSRIHTRSRAHSASAKRTIGDALERDSCRRNVGMLLVWQSGAFGKSWRKRSTRILAAALRTDGVDVALRRSKREIARCQRLVQNLPRCASEVTPAGAAALGPVLGGAACLIIELP